MDRQEMVRKVRVAVGIEPGHDAGEVALALAVLSLLGVVSWAAAGLALGMAREGVLALLLS